MASDHCPLLISYNKARPTPIKKLFRFEQMWMHDTGCLATIKNSWETPSQEKGMTRVMNKIENCRKQLIHWSKTQFGSVRHELKQKTDQLRVAELDSMNGGGHTSAKILKVEVRDLLDKEESMWRQRSRIQWLQGGDQNSRFFHSKATQRKRRNIIEFIEDSVGEVRTNPQEITALFVNYFDNLF
jgi:hypothetical protein